MKLSNSQQGRIGRVGDDPDAVPEAPPADMLAAALALAADGWNVFPLRPGTKIPLIPRAHERGQARCNGECGRDGHGAHDGTTDRDRITRWWTTNPRAGIGANLGEDRLAIDLDFNHGADITGLDFPATRVHLSGRGGGNRHLIYRIEPGTQAALIKSGTDVLGKGIDIRAGAGSYIVMPPTPHELTRRPYTVADDNQRLEHVLTDSEVESLFGEALAADKPTRGRARAKAAAKGITMVQGGRSRPKTGVSHLSDLLDDPPKRGEGRMNDWLTRVAGHYAKMHRDKQDLYETEVRRAAAMVDPDYEDIDKILDSVWRSETEGHPERGASISNGFLVGNGRTLQCQVTKKEGEDTVYDLAPFGDFDITARGVAVDEMDHRMFWIRLHWHGQDIDTTLDSELLGDDRALRKWLAARGASVDPPFNAVPKTATGVRLLRYLNHQKPPRVQIVDTLGWHRELGFVTHDGVITADGQQAKEDAGVVADPHLVERDVAPFTYGFQADPDEAVRVLREVLTFQDSTTASVFGAWWAACLLRPQIQARSSLFPFFGVEATSESGKTNGFFELMVQLNGNTRGEIAPTRPVLRDYASANRNGIVWADDLDSLEAYGELLRASTSNGTAAKMDIDRSGIKNTQVVAPILITGEALGMSEQKALIDRSVVVTPISPKDRRSLHGDYLQWDDVLELKAQYPDDQGGLSVLAGHLVQMALALEAPTLLALKKAKKAGSGRHGDKMAVMLAGAMLLDALVGEENPWEGTGQHAARVSDWIREQGVDRLDRDNAATLKMIPWALRTWGYPRDPEVGAEMGRFAAIDCPVFIRKDKRVAGLDDPDTLQDAVSDSGIEVWVSAANLAYAWARDHNHRTDQRTETEGAVRQQLDALRCPSRVFNLNGSRRKARFRLLPAEYGLAVIARARG